MIRRLRSRAPRRRGGSTYGPHKCKLCPQSFMTADGLKAHVEQKHNGGNSPVLV